MRIDLKNVVVVAGSITLLLGVFVFGCDVGRHAERETSPLQVVRGVNCQLPHELEVLVVFITREKNTISAHTCTTVKRWKIDPS